MDDGSDGAGRRLGPYHLDTRYQDLDEPGGQVYAAHHVDTGHPALVLVPEPGDLWAPRSNWTVRVTSQVSPPFLATELERPPPAKADVLTDVDLGFIRLAGAIATVEDRQDAHDAFTQKPTPRPGGAPLPGPPRWRHVGTGALGAALVLMAVLLWPRLLGSPPQDADTTELQPIAPSVWANRKQSPPGIGYPMPKAPFPGQQKPPCGDKGYVEIRGGCWVQAKQDAPCAKDIAEYEGHCYVPLREEKPEPRALEP